MQIQTLKYIRSTTDAYDHLVFRILRKYKTTLKYGSFRRIFIFMKLCSAGHFLSDKNCLSTRGAIQRVLPHYLGLAYR